MTNDEIVKCEERLNKAKSLRSQITNLSERWHRVNNAACTVIVCHRSEHSIGTNNGDWAKITGKTVNTEIPSSVIEEANKAMKDLLLKWLSSEQNRLTKELEAL